jgi:hypothetical protein
MNSSVWMRSYRTDPLVKPLADCHYNRQNPDSANFAPPGRTLVLRTSACDAFWITSWPYARYVRHHWAGAFVCSAFRNESTLLSSWLIREALACTVWKWGQIPTLGMVTFIDPRKVKKKRDFGRCFLRAGFRRARCRIHQEIQDGCASCHGRTKSGLIALQIDPEEFPDLCSPMI